MARSATNFFGLRFAPETTLGVKPTSGWRLLEPNNPSAFGATITPVERRPISAERGRRKGTVVDEDSSVEYEGDVTMDSFDDFAEGFVFSEYANTDFTFGDLVVASGTTFTVASLASGIADKLTSVVAADSLLFGQGYANAGNNGLHALTVDPVVTDTTLTVGGSSLVAETPPTNARLDVCGIRFAIADLALTVSGSTATLVSTAGLTDWSDLGLLVGQYIHIGSSNEGAVQNGMGVGTDIFGYARITSISTVTLNLDKLDTNLATDAGNSTLTDVMFGRFLRNVSVTADADDNRFVERSYSFEGAYADLEGAGTDAYEYAVGNLANELVLNWPLTDKATATWGFTGTTTEDITASRATGPSVALTPIRTNALNTASDVASLTTDVVSAVSDVCFKSLTLSLKNNVTPEKCLGTLGASFMNSGLFEVNLEGQMLFTRKEITNAVKNNTTVTFAAIFKNDDGAVAIDIPSMTFGDGSREFPVDASVLVNISGQAFNDPTGTIPNVSIGISLFPTVPTAR